MSKSASSRPFLILCCTAMLGACTPPNALKASSMAVAEILEKESQVELIEEQIHVKTSPNIQALRLPEQSFQPGAN